MRDHFKKELNKVPKGKSGASQEFASEYTGKWSYFYQMLFLKDVLLPRNTESNLQGRVDLSSQANDNTQNSTQNTDESEDETQITDEPEHTTLSQSEHVEPEILRNESMFAAPSTATVSTDISTVPKKKQKNCPTKTTSDRSTFETELLRIESEKTLLLQNELKKEDEDLHFFKSLIPYFKKLQPLQKLRVRNEFQTILISALDPQQTNQTSNVGCSSSSSNTPLLSPATPVLSPATPLQPPPTPVLSLPEYTSANPGTSQFGTLHNIHQYF